MPEPSVELDRNRKQATLERLAEAVLSADAETRPVTFVTVGGQGQAAIIPAAEYHDPHRCCCKNCPYGGDHAD